MKRVQRKADYISHSDMINKWNTADPKSNGEASAQFQLLLDIRSLLSELLEQGDTVVEEKKQEQDNCSSCGLKRKFWGKMFCGEGGEHKE